MTEEFELAYSPLQGPVTRDGVTVDVRIYRGEGDPGWLLEVVDDEGGSTVWDDLFPTDQAAFDEARRAIEEDGIDSFAPGPPADPDPLWAELRESLGACEGLRPFERLRGMFAAVATAPGLHPPGEWMPRALGEYTSSDTRELEAITGDLVSLYTAVLEALQDDAAQACCPDPSDEDAVRDFCLGYIEIAGDDEECSKRPPPTPSSSLSSCLRARCPSRKPVNCFPRLATTSTAGSIQRGARWLTTSPISTTTLPSPGWSPRSGCVGRRRRCAVRGRR